MTEITDLFISILNEAPSIDMAEAEFKCRLVDDPELRRQYREYCREQGVSERRCFLDFCEEYWENRDEAWNSLSDFDNQE